MKLRKVFCSARVLTVALCLALTAALFAIPAFADSEGGASAAPFYFTPIGMAAILFVLAMAVVGIVALVRANKRKAKGSEPTVIPLSPKPAAPEQIGSFAEDVERYAREEAEKAAAADKKELNRAINEVLYAETLAAWRDSHRTEAPAAEVAREVEPTVTEQPDAVEPLPTVEPIEELPEDVSGDLADRVERRMDRRIGADDVEQDAAEEQALRAAAYHAAFEEAKNISADTEDAIELVEDTSDEVEPVAETVADIAPEVTETLVEELEQTEQALASDADEVEAVVADIRDSVLAEGEEPIELTEETEEVETVEEIEAVEETEPVEDMAETEEVEPEITADEEPTAAAFAEVEETVIEETVEDEVEEIEDTDETDADEGDGEGETEAVASFGGQRIVYIDAKANPEAYAELLEREKRGEVTLVYRYRKSFLSKMATAEEQVKFYYNEIKNALLAYKGVKCRTSWGYEAFNKGRIKVARMDIKPRSLYLYLAIDPASLADTKYNFKDMSEKKKYAATPVLMKIRGERKFKHALELIASLCGDDGLQLKRLEVEPTDYRLPMMTQEEMVEAGYVKMMVGAIPVQPEVATETENATESAENAAENVTEAAATTTEQTAPETDSVTAENAIDAEAMEAAENTETVEAVETADVVAVAETAETAETAEQTTEAQTAGN